MNILIELRDKINKQFKIEIQSKSRQQPVVFGRKLYARLGRELGFTLVEMGKNVNLDHPTILHHCNTFNVVDKNYKVMYNSLANYYGLNVLEPKEIKPTNNNNILNEINIIVSQWDDATLNDFLENRLKVYAKTVDSRIMPKEIQEIKGAYLRNA